MEQNEGAIDLSKLFHIMAVRWKVGVTLILTCTVLAGVGAFVWPQQ